jgi:hypothetical protein
MAALYLLLSGDTREAVPNAATTPTKEISS